MIAMRPLSAIVVSLFALILQTAAANAVVRTQYVDYRDGDAQLSGFLAYDDARTGKRPGVLLVHYRGGLQGETLEAAEMIAKMG